jgi:hypothetical protein
MHHHAWIGSLEKGLFMQMKLESLMGKDASRPSSSSPLMAKPKALEILGCSFGDIQRDYSHTSTTKKVHLNAHMSVKPQDDWVGFYFPEKPFVPKKPHIRT